MKRRRKAAHSGVDAIQEELANIGEEVAALGKSLGDTASAEARDAMKSIRDGLDRIAGDSGTYARAGVGAIESRIEGNPFTSVAIAFGFGVILASLLRR